jgi:hypothetical protein
VEFKEQVSMILCKLYGMNFIALLDANIFEDQLAILYSEAAYVDSQHEYLQEHKSEGITLEELRRKRASQH